MHCRLPILGVYLIHPPKKCFLNAGTGVDAFLKFALPLSHDIPKVAGEKRTNE